MQIAGSCQRNVVAVVFSFRNVTVGDAFIVLNIIVEACMFAKPIVAAFAATALLSTAALAQTTAPKDPAAAPSAQSSSTPKAEAKPVQNQSSTEWRSSKVVGLYVYNDANERLGTINELLMDSSGKVAKAVIGVGGFLGIGESDIAVEFDKLKFSNEPMRTTSATGGTTGGSSTGTTGSSGGATTGAATAPASKPSINPDHAKLSMTKDQLKAMPQFKYAN
jgi:hypothetical protein